jgi:hypothetical protein
MGVTGKKMSVESQVKKAMDMEAKRKSGVTSPMMK